ncbi:MAG TPA: hypothetical protein DHV59_15095 [Oxalobacteraceae bacterium]|nr:hypothetical protein [Oxalobacteraceae bacterium]
MPNRRKTPSAVETSVLYASRRRCCLCVFLDERDEVRRGQLAHINRDPSDATFENLVWLCLDHHDEYDSKTSQSKGVTQAEVKKYRDRLYDRHPEATQKAVVDSKEQDLPELVPLPPRSEFESVRRRFPKDLGFMAEPWRYPLWQVANQPELFAFKSGNGSDGICLIERIDLPDERIVVACMSVVGNPGISITNAVEDICFQVCERFEIPPDRLVWLEHYEDFDDEEWDMVTFGTSPPQGPFSNPTWKTMTPQLWKSLLLEPKKQLLQEHRHYQSKLNKLFYWPTKNLL